MRGDQLARQWPIIWAINASRLGLTVAEIVRGEAKEDPEDGKSFTSLFQKMGRAFLS